MLVVSAAFCVDPLIFHQMWCQHDELLYVGRMPPILFFKCCVCWCKLTAVLGESLPFVCLEVWFCEVMWQVVGGW